MPGRVSQVEHVAAISRVSQLGSQAELFRNHLTEIVSSHAFRGSRRSQEFLQHLVEKALSGQFDDLKERAIGVELFGRPADYDTGGDAIVRVSASEVRRRLLQFYSEAGAEPAFRIELPAGSYIPEFRQIAQHEGATTARVAEPDRSVADGVSPRLRYSRQKLVYMGAGVCALVLITVALWSIRSPQVALNDADVQPWAALLRKDHQTKVILCDADISKLQGLLDYRVSLSDYANHKYLPDSLSVSPDMQRAIQMLRGVDVASVDTSIALIISELAVRRGRQIRTRTARSMQLSDFKVDEDFILLGSPRSNPWFALFDDNLDFRFEYDAALKVEVIRNRKVRNGESAQYVPTAQGWETGHSYGIVAFLRNPGQNGHILLLAGSNAEATEAAGKLVTNLELLSQVLKAHGVSTSGSQQSFEILLRASIMAGSSNTFEVVACHRLADGQ